MPQENEGVKDWSGWERVRVRWRDDVSGPAVTQVDL